MVARAQRFSKSHPCPICDGYEQAKRGTPERCWGYLSDDGQWAHCVRDEKAGPLRKNLDSDTYAHKLSGDCLCGHRHDPRPVEPRHATNGHQGKRQVATYDYVDADGTLRY